MKNCFLILSICLFLCCENNIEINDSWSDIPVIYTVFNSGTQEDADGSGFEQPTPYASSFLNPDNLDFNFDSDSDPDFNYTHIVRVQKSFLGSESAYNYVDNPDSIYYNPNNISVWLELVDPTYLGNVSPAQIPLELIDDVSGLESLDLLKEDGLFNSDNHHVYLLPNTTPNATDLCQGDCENIHKNYKIFVLNHVTGDTAFAETNIVQPLDMGRPRPTGTQSILRLGLENTPVTIEIEPSKNAKMYSIVLRFNYLEQSRTGYITDLAAGNVLPTSDVVHKYVDWTFNDIVITDENQLNGLGNYIKKSFYGGEFFTFLKSNISEQDDSQPDFYRYPLNTFYQNNNAGVIAGIYHRCIDLHVTAINSELYTYLTANAPNYGLNQERPEYNNIINGIGHISSRSMLKMNNLRINQEAADSLSFGEITKKLNFSCYNTQGSGSFLVEFGFDCQ